MTFASKRMASFLMVLTIITSGCGAVGHVASGGTSPAIHEVTPEAAKIVGGMSVEQKVGQLFMIRRKAATDAALQSGKFGGVVFFGEDGDFSGSAADIANRTNPLQKIAATSGSHLPLLVATDEEYGSTVGRLTNDQATIFPGNMALGATGDPKLAEAEGKASGAELKALGFNVNFAPDADVNYNPLNPVIGVRSFGDDPKAVADMTAQAVHGYQASGIAATAKHFPGHGNTNIDSHNGLPVINGSQEEFKKNNLPPFEAAIKTGVDMVMVGHIKVPALDPEQPASLSHKITSDLLRGELGFHGVVVTDSLEMDGVKTGLSQAEIAIQAFLAGADILLMPRNLDVAYNAILNEVKKPGGRISAKALDDAATRIAALKLEDGLKQGVAPAANQEGLKSEVAAKACTDIGTQSITLLAGPPAFGEGKPVFVTGYGSQAVETLYAQFPKNNQSASLPLGTQGYTDSRIAEATAKVRAAPANQVIVLVMNSPASYELKYLDALKATGHPVYVVLVRLPYAGAYTGAADTTMAAYSSTACSMRAAAQVLLGKQKPGGKLPVALPDGSGHVKYQRGYSK